VSAGSGPGGDARTAYQYVLLRCVPVIARAEAVNVGVVVCVPSAGYLAVVRHVDAVRLGCLRADLDLTAVDTALDHLEALCAGTPDAGPGAGLAPRDRFGIVAAARSTVVQPGPVHGGLLAGEDPARVLERLADELVR